MNCAQCDEGPCALDIKDDVIEYGYPVAVKIPVRVPVYTCKACKFSFMDDDAFRVRSAVVNEYVFARDLALLGRENSESAKVLRKIAEFQASKV